MTVSCFGVMPGKYGGDIHSAEAAFVWEEGE